MPFDELKQAVSGGRTRIGQRDIEPNAVKNRHIANLSFDKASGGTLVLGGANNVEGLVQLYDANSNLIFQGDKEGHKYYDTSSNALVTIDEEGLHAYDTSTNELIKVDSTGFHAYNTSAQELIKVDSVGFHAYNTSGTELYRMEDGGFYAYGTAATLINLRNTATSASFGQLGYFLYDGNYYFAIASGNSKGIIIDSDEDLYLVPDADTIISSGVNTYIIATTGETYIKADAGHVWFEGDSSNDYLFYDSNDSTYRELDMIADKQAIMPTSKGYRSLYCMESPNAWFMDFCFGYRKTKTWWKFWSREWVIRPDPLFMEVTEGEIVVTPTGLKNVVQIWRKRRGKTDKRFEERTEEQFKQNNKFWGSAYGL